METVNAIKRQRTIRRRQVTLMWVLLASTNIGWLVALRYRAELTTRARAEVYRTLVLSAGTDQITRMAALDLCQQHLGRWAKSIKNSDQSEIAKAVRLRGLAMVDDMIADDRTTTLAAYGRTQRLMSSLPVALGPQADLVDPVSGRRVVVGGEQDPHVDTDHLRKILTADTDTLAPLMTSAKAFAGLK